VSFWFLPFRVNDDRRFKEPMAKRVNQQEFWMGGELRSKAKIVDWWKERYRLNRLKNIT
jgi:hypothetical protein